MKALFGSSPFQRAYVEADDARRRE